MEEIIVVDKTTGELSIPKQIIEAIRINQVTLKQAKESDKEFKKRLREAMEEFGVEKITSDVLTVNYVGEYEKTSVDLEKLKRDYPEAYFNCLKESQVSASVKVRLK